MEETTVEVSVAEAEQFCETIAAFNDVPAAFTPATMLELLETTYRDIEEQALEFAPSELMDEIELLRARNERFHELLEASDLSDAQAAAASEQATTESGGQARFDEVVTAFEAFLVEWDLANC